MYDVGLIGYGAFGMVLVQWLHDSDSRRFKVIESTPELLNKAMADFDATCKTLNQR